MQKFFLISLISLLAESMALSPAVGSQYPEVPTSDIDLLSCYMQTVDGKTLDLDSLCEKMPEDSDSSSSANSSKDSANSLAASKCYIFDAAGRPCPNSN